MICIKKYLLGALGCVIAGTMYAQQENAFPAFPPDDVTALMDRDQMMRQLGIEFPRNLPEPEDDPNRPLHIKPGQNAWQWTDDTGYLPQSPMGLLINRTAFGLWLNYKEEPACVGIYTPIDLLKTEDGTRIASAGEWWNKRRPELQKMCQEEIWGVIPEAARNLKVTWDIQHVSVHDSVYGTFEEKTVTGLVDASSYPALKHQPQIKGRLYLPTGAKNVPVVVQYAWFRFPPHPVYLEECISRGWGFLQMDCTALQPDNGASLTDYLIGLVSKGNWRKPHDWGALAAWSWGVSRLIDFFETNDAFDAKRVGITGHSRYGKAALVTMAYEPRVAVAYVSCSGAGGASPIRRHCAQDLESVAWDTEYHWLAGNFMRWLGPLEKDGYFPRKYEQLKVDAHALLSLCAPRPVLITGGTTDYWCDSYGMYLTCRDAGPVYELLGAKGVRMEDERPVPDKGYMEGTIAYRNHEGWHVDYLDWPVFAKWASSHAMGEHPLPLE